MLTKQIKEIKMNNLNKIRDDIQNNKLEGLKILPNLENLSKSMGEEVLQLVEERSPTWSIYYTITEDKVNVVEINYNCDYPEQSNIDTKLFEEALKIASEWC